MQLGIYILIGLLAGLLSGLIGIGGGIVIVPALTALLFAKDFPEDFLMQVVIGTSLAAILVTTFVGTWSQNRRGAVNWSLLRTFIPSLVGGVFVGILLTKEIPTDFLRGGFAVFSLFIGSWMLLRAGQVPKQAPAEPHALKLLIALGALVGLASGLLGIGGGVLLVPIFLGLGVAMPQASANSVACAVPTALTGMLMAIAVGWGEVSWPHLLGFVYWPAALAIGLASAISAPWGVYLCHRLPVPVIKRIFGGILLLIAWEMAPL